MPRENEESGEIKEHEAPRDPRENKESGDHKEHEDHQVPVGLRLISHLPLLRVSVEFKG